MIEAWLPVVGYEDRYEVSDMGRVRSVARNDIRNCRWGGKRVYPVKSKLLRQQRGNTDGRYLYVHLRDGEDGTTLSVHTLMLEAFVGPRPAGMEACHYNDVGHDNRLENLRWDTKGNNYRDRVRNRKAV